MRNSRFLGLLAMIFLIISLFVDADKDFVFSATAALISLVGIICDSIEKIGSKNEQARRSEN